MKNMKKIISSILLSSVSLLAAEYTLKPGWNLLGTSQEIQTSNILQNDAVRNVVIYEDGAYKSTASNEFDIIPKGSGFFVYTDSSITIDISDNLPTSNLVKLDGDLQENNSPLWPILKITDANLYVEMKTSDFIAGTTYTNSEASNYCITLL